jgi:hypothetical protein
MNRLILCTLAVFSFATTVIYGQDADGRRIRSGDVLLVKVSWPPKGDLQVAREKVVVSPDGKITPPKLPKGKDGKVVIMRSFDEVKVSDLDTSQAEGQVLQGYFMAMPGAKLRVAIERVSLGR